MTIKLDVQTENDMIYERRAKLYCKEDISLIENYDKAINDKSQTWHCHHRDEVKVLPSGMKVYRSKEELMESGRYYHCPANELIFLTYKEHNAIHKGNPKLCSKEHKLNQSKAFRNKVYSEFGKLFFETYGIHRMDNIRLYCREREYYNRHKKLKGVK